MEPDTAVSLFENYLHFHAGIYMKLLQIWFDINPQMPGGMPIYMMPTLDDLIYHLQNDDAFSCAMARIKYLPVPQAIPKTVEGQAEYWKRCYNTPTGAQTVEHYLSQWEACNCANLLKG